MTPAVDPSLFSEDMTALLGGMCAACSTQMFPRRPCCPKCQSAEVNLMPLAASGRIWTFTVLHAAPPGYVGPVPYALGIVEVDSGVRVTSMLLADDINHLRIGDRVRFELTEIGPPEERRTTFAFRQSRATEGSAG